MVGTARLLVHGGGHMRARRRVLVVQAARCALCAPARAPAALRLGRFLHAPQPLSCVQIFQACMLQARGLCAAAMSSFVVDGAKATKGTQRHLGSHGAPEELCSARRLIHSLGVVSRVRPCSTVT